MNIASYIENSSTLSGAKSFRLGFLAEMQEYLDSLNFIDYPVHLSAPIIINGQLTGAQNKIVCPLQGWFLLRAPEPIDYRTTRCEDEYITPMRKMCLRFIKNVCNEDIVDFETAVRYNVKPEFSITTGLLYGVMYTLSWPINIDAGC